MPEKKRKGRPLYVVTKETPKGKKMSNKLFTLQQVKKVVEGTDMKYEVMIKEAVVYDLVDYGHVMFFDDIGDTVRYM